MKKAIKRGLSMLFMVVFLVSAMSLPASAAKKTSADTKYKTFSGPYQCNIATALDMNNLLDVTCNGKEPGTNVGTWEANWTEAQDFTFERPENTTDKDYKKYGWHLIKATASGLYLDLEGASKENGANVALHTKNGGNNQLWRLIPTSLGYFIESRVGTYLTAETLDADWPNVYCSRYTGGVNQRWFLNPFDGTLTTNWIQLDTPTVKGNTALINFRYRVCNNSLPEIRAVIEGAEDSSKPTEDFGWSFSADNLNYVWQDSVLYGSGTLKAISTVKKMKNAWPFRLVAQDSSGTKIVKSAKVTSK